MAGPIVLELQYLFVADWFVETDEVLDEEVYLPAPEITGTMPMQVLPSGPGYDVENVQRLVLTERSLAREYSEADLSKHFKANGSTNVTDPTYQQSAQTGFADWRLEVGGLVERPVSLSLAELRKLPARTQITRHDCVEGWSAIGKWGGVPFGDFLRRIDADTTARYVGFKCADGYYSSVDMATALHPQTILALTFRDETLPAEYGFPMKLRAPTKLGFKNPKHIMALYVTNTHPGGYWEDQGYNWFSGS